MGMLLRRYYDNTAKSGAKSAPSEPTHEEIKQPEIKVEKDAPEEKKLTRSDIMKMNVAQVRAYAEEQGIKDANAMSGAELKRILGDRLFDESE